MRYTNFDKLIDDAADYGSVRVWIRSGDVPVSIKVRIYEGYEPEFYWNGIECTEDSARSVFNLEMRVCGWVSTERPE